MAPPGTYHVLLKLGEEVMSKKLEVIKDPHSEGTLADIRLQNELMKKIYDDLNITANYINSMEIARRQLLDLKSILSNTNQKEVLIALVDSLALDFLNLEKKLIQLKATGTGQDDVRFKKMIGEKLAYLGGNVPNADFRPADSYYEVYELLSDRLKEVGVQFEKLKNERVKEVLDVLSEAGVNMIIIE
jgi:phosphoribulokinase